MYKDKQREADAERQRRYRAERQRCDKAKQKALLSEGVTVKGVTRRDKGVTESGRDKQGVTPSMIPNGDTDIGAVKALHQLISNKRGKDIKTFADLPPDVQESIHKDAMTSSGPNETKFRNRTAIAIAYQHTFGEAICLL